MFSKQVEEEMETEFKGPGPLLRPQGPPPPPPTEIPRQLSNFEQENSSTANIESPTLLFQFTDLFENFDYGTIRKRIIDRNLNEFPFKTVLWRSFLHCLPADSSKWSGALEESRTIYNELADRYNIESDKLSEKTKIEQTDDHPLSQDEGSPWANSFQHRELRDNLVQDVRRTFPELSFFHQEEIQRLLTKVLFIYSLKHEKTLPYRQGMHEILAVIVFNIHNEATRVNNYSESNDLMKLVYDLRYLEHDAFSIYEKVVEHLQPFYDIRKENSATKQSITTNKSGVRTGPMSDTESRVNNIVRRLRQFNETIDRQLQELDIEPTIYGIRWLRLLFGREVAFGTIPNLWTLIFCYDNNFGFVDFFFLALLIERAKHLTKKRNSMCFSSSLQTLLPNEVISDPEYIIRQALWMAQQQSSRVSNISSRPPVSNRSNPFGFDQENGVRDKESSFFTSISNRFVTNENSKSLPSMPNRSKFSSSGPHETELEDEPGKETRKQIEENIELQKKVTNLIDKNLEKLDNALKKNSIADENDVVLRIRNCINGVEYIDNVLKGLTTFDTHVIQKFLPSTDEKETISD